MKTIEKFCKLHHACSEDREWALANCKDTRQVWDTARPEWLVWIATRPGVLTDNELRRFAIFCARNVEHLLTDERSRHAIDVAERFLNGNASAAELEAAARAAWAASRAADEVADAAAAWATWAATWAADITARAAWAADIAAAAAARAAWTAAADAAAVAGAAAAQAEWLRANTNPTF